MKNAFNVIAIIAILIFFVCIITYQVLQSSDKKDEKVTKVFGWAAVGSLCLALLSNICALFQWEFPLNQCPKQPEISGYFCFMNRTVTILNDADLENIRHWAELKYSISQIATMLMLDVAELRMALQDQKSQIAMAYNAGKLEGQITRREAVLKAANNGAEWAIKILDGWEKNQTEEELMP